MAKRIITGETMTKKSKDMSKDIVKQIYNVLQQTHLDPNCLNLEITESMLMEDPSSNISIRPASTL